MKYENTFKQIFYFLDVIIFKNPNFIKSHFLRHNNFPVLSEKSKSKQIEWLVSNRTRVLREEELSKRRSHREIRKKILLFLGKTAHSFKTGKNSISDTQSLNKEV